MSCETSLCCLMAMRYFFFNGMKKQDNIYVIVTNINPSHNFKMYTISIVQRNYNAKCMNKINLSGINLQWPPFYHPNSVKAGRKKAQNIQVSLQQDPSATKSTPPTRLFPSFGTRRAVKFKKEHLFFIGGAFKCSLKCPSRLFLVLFHNGLPF